MFDEAQLRRDLKNYASYYNQVRTHLPLDKNAANLRRPQKLGSIASIAILVRPHHQQDRGPARHWMLTFRVNQVLRNDNPEFSEMFI